MDSPQRWHRVSETPLMPCIQDNVWDRHPSAPNVLRVGDHLRMYYHGRQGELIRIGFAEAPADNPFSWTRHPGNPVLDLGGKGQIDSHWVAYPWVVPITDTHWHMYHATFGGTYLDEAKTFKIWRTALAESDDAGITWTRTGRPLFELERPQSADQHGTGSCCVRKVGTEYWMWYTAISRPRDDWHRITVALATSADGGHTFRPHPKGEVLALPPWIGATGSTCSRPFVECAPQGFRVWFSCARDGEHYRIHYAESPDGIHLRWSPEPVLDVSESGWDRTMTCYPSVLHIGDRTLLYYAGDGYASIGAAEMTQ